MRKLPDGANVLLVGGWNQCRRPEFVVCELAEIVHIIASKRLQLVRVTLDDWPGPADEFAEKYHQLEKQFAEVLPASIGFCDLYYNLERIRPWDPNHLLWTERAIATLRLRADLGFEKLQAQATERAMASLAAILSAAYSM